MIVAKDLRRMIAEGSAGQRLQGVIGGPPCQGFSRGNASADPDDPRNQLPFKFADLLGDLNARHPLKFFVFENVMGLANPRHMVRFLAIRQAFADAGFRIFYQDLDAQEFGVPQLRRRLFIVGLNAKQFRKTDFTFPEGGRGKVTVRDAIKGLPDPVFFERGINARRIKYHPNHWTMKPKSQKLLASAHQVDGRSFRRLAWDEVSPTVAYGNRRDPRPSGRRTPPHRP